ncbi:MAG: DinB family protein, partial [Gemmatimonadota bacterium]|nr:DinB family protein [Gemmatimonadota bacterium]
MKSIQRDLHQQLKAEAIATRERIARIIKPLDEAKLNEHPEPAGWSIAQVLEHLILGDEKYEAPFAAVLRRARPDAGAPSREWKSSLLGGMIAGAILKPKPLKAPKVFDPGPTPRRGTAQAFLDGETSFVKAMDD